MKREGRVYRGLEELTYLFHDQRILVTRSVATLYLQSMSPKRLTNFRIDVELLRGLEILRDRKDFAVSWQVRQAIKEWLEKYDVEIKKEVKPPPRARRKRGG